MSTKSFAGTPKPARQPTPDEISAFEETGRAIARERKATAKAEKREHRKAESLKHGKADKRKGGKAATQKTANTEIREPINMETLAVEAVVRLTIDLPESTHTRFKAACAMAKRKMVEEVRGLIERRTTELESGSDRPQ